MTWLLFLDESGHDHKTMPYEVRGGVALRVSHVWAFVQAMRSLEVASFGAALSEFGTELKGARLVDRDRFIWAAQGPPIAEESRRRSCRSFFERGRNKQSPTREEFTAYGQASIGYARGVFQLLSQFEAVVFAAATPRGVARMKGPEPELLRKDHVFLFERFFYFLEAKQDHGLLVLDQVEKSEDARFLSRLQRYFERTATGRYRTAWIVPLPLFVSSDLVPPVQAADLCIYCLNWGFRMPAAGMNAPVRQEIATEFALWIARLQFRGDGYRDGRTYATTGIVFVPDPFQRRQ